MLYFQIKVYLIFVFVFQILVWDQIFVSLKTEGNYNYCHCCNHFDHCCCCCCCCNYYWIGCCCSCFDYNFDLIDHLMTCGHYLNEKWNVLKNMQINTKKKYTNFFDSGFWSVDNILNFYVKKKQTSWNAICFAQMKKIFYTWNGKKKRKKFFLKGFTVSCFWPKKL